jgi:hypothetical protein
MPREIGSAPLLFFPLRSAFLNETTTWVLQS